MKSLNEIVDKISKLGGSITLLQRVYFAPHGDIYECSIAIPNRSLSFTERTSAGFTSQTVTPLENAVHNAYNALLSELKNQKSKLETDIGNL